MIKIKYERDKNGRSRQHLEKTFSGLKDLENWIFEQMERHYSIDDYAIHFPNPDPMLETPPYIVFQPVYAGDVYRIHQIENNENIVFSDGTHTDGQKYWSEEIQQWLAECKKNRRKNPKFVNRKESL